MAPPRLNGLSLQVFPLLHHRRVPRRRLHQSPRMAHDQPPTSTVDCHDRRLYAVCALARGAHSRLHRALGPDGVGEQQLQSSGVQSESGGSEHRDAGVVATEKHM